jgi:hypothetical protein
MGAGGNFGNNAAIGCMSVNLAGDNTGKDPRLTALEFNNRCGGFITAGFNSKDNLMP